MPSQSQFSRSLPPHPDLEQQKKQARELLQAFAAGDAQTRARVRDALPDKPEITLTDAQFVLAREYGFVNWSALKEHIELDAVDRRSPQDRMHDAFTRRDAAQVRRLLEAYPAFKAMVNAPVLAFNSPPIVACANDLAMVEVLLDYGADPNKRSEWWAGGFHALHSATGAAADRLIAAGAIPDACAAANLDRLDLLAEMIAEDPKRVHERGGDGKTPLHFARSREVVDFLLDAGADIDARDMDHRSTAAEWMLDREGGAGRYDLARHLVERGASADIFLAAALGLTDRVRTMVQASPRLLELRTGRGDYGEKKPSSYHIYFWTIGDNRSPLDVAAQFGQPETLDAMWGIATPMQRLLCASQNGDEVRARAVIRENPEIIASMSEADHRAVTDAAWNGNARAVVLMLELGFDPRTPGQDSGTALHCAAWQGSVDTVAALLGHPAGRALVGVYEPHHGASPLGWCCHGSRFANAGRDYAAVAKMLLDAGAQPGPDCREASAEVTALLDDWRRRRTSEASERRAPASTVIGWATPMDDDMVFAELVTGLKNGDFSRLEPLFDPIPPDSDSPVVRWHREGRFAGHPDALNEALTCACWLGKLQVAEYLLDAGVNPSGGMATGLDAIHWAANRGQLDAVRLLIGGELSLTTRNMYGGEPSGLTVWSAINEPRASHPAILEELLAAGAPFPHEEYPSGNQQIDAVLERYRS